LEFDEDWLLMEKLRRIAVSQRALGETGVIVVELLDPKLSGPTLTQELAEDLLSLLEKGKPTNVLLNLVQVEFISSAALNRLINFQKRVQDSGGKLKLCGLRPSIESVFAATRLNQVFDLCKNEDDALAHFENASQHLP
jgi:anti-anti-sigma factor